MTPRIVTLAVSAFLLGSVAWASTSSCTSQSNSTDGCSTTNSQFVNIFTVGDTATYQFNTSASHGSGPFGTILLTQFAADTVRITVTLNSALFPNIGFVNASGQEALDFNLAGNPSIQSNQITNLTAGFSFPGAQLSAPPYGTFMYAVHCDVCGNGGSHPYTGQLVFDVSLVSGISISSFTQNSAGAFFASDIIANGATFDVSAETPEPATFWLMGGALALLGLFGWSRNKALA
jgi:PEP-CTERM motif